jgi:hypothetical protein
MGIYGYIFKERFTPSSITNGPTNYHFRNAISKKGGYWVVKVGVFK